MRSARASRAALPQRAGAPARPPRPCMLPPSPVERGARQDRDQGGEARASAARGEENDIRNPRVRPRAEEHARLPATEKTFWIIVGVGMLFAVASLVGMYVFGEVTDVTSVQGMLSTGALVVAYACVIAPSSTTLPSAARSASRPRRGVGGRSEKKLVELFEQERAAQLPARPPRTPAAPRSSLCRGRCWVLECGPRLRSSGIEHRSPKAGVGRSNRPGGTRIFAGQWLCCR